MGAVLLQKKEDGKKHPIAYYSKTLSAAERNYDVYDLELLAIVNALDHWRLSRTCSFIRFSELEVLIIRYDKMVSHMRPHVH
jgi:hypothetical protein